MVDLLLEYYFYTHRVHQPQINFTGIHPIFITGGYLEQVAILMNFNLTFSKSDTVMQQSLAFGVLALMGAMAHHPANESCQM